MAKGIKVDGKIHLDQFLKWANVSSTGGQGKILILNGLVKVNGITETRRRRTLVEHDLVEVENEGSYEVIFRAGED